jgi:hypothetical protein
MPLFASFPEAWRWFVDGGELVGIDEQRDSFAAGRAQFLSFQAPAIDARIVDLARTVRDELRDVDGLLPLDDDLLHCTVRPAGFQVLAKRRPDDVLREEVAHIGERAAAALASRRPIEVTVGPVNIFPDALILEVHDRGELGAMRSALAGVTPAQDPNRWPGAPEFLPHISLAFFADTSCAAALRERLPALRERQPVASRIARLDFARWWFVGDPREQPELDVLRSYRFGG